MPCLRRRRDDGAALVEFALVAMPLFLILFGTMEFGWAFFQLNDVRHGAREGIRVVAVNADVDPEYGDAEHGSPMTQVERLSQATCERMDRKKDVSITLTYDDVDSDGVLEVGDDALLEASKPLQQLTNVFDAVLGSVTLDEAITTRLEQNPPEDVVADTEYTWTCK